MIYVIVIKDRLDITGSYSADNSEADSELCTHLQLPENLDPACVKAVLIDSQITLVEDPDKVAAKVQAAKDALVAAAKVAFDTEVDAQMFIVYGTRDRIVGGVTQQSWMDMYMAPADYVPAIFPSVEALQSYVGAKLATARAFNIWRIGRLAQRDAEIAAILA